MMLRDIRATGALPSIARCHQEGDGIHASRCVTLERLGKAISYTLSLWHKLTRFLEYPEIELSNNLAENSMRPVVLEQKLDPCRQSTSRAESRRNSIGSRKLSSAEDSCA